MSKKLWLTVILFLSSSLGVFLMPITIAYSQNNLSYLTALIVPTLVILINAFPLIVYSEILKIYCGNQSHAKQCKRTYRFFIENNCFLKVSLFNTISTCILTFMYYIIFGKFHIRAILIHNFAILISYTSGCFAFDSIKKNSLNYRKRDYLIFRPYLLLSVPICASIYLIDMLSGQLELITLPFIISFITVVYSIITYKNVITQKWLYAVFVIGIIAFAILLYFKFGLNGEDFINKNINAVFFSLGFGLYIYLLLSLIYVDIYPIRTISFKHSIEKFQYSLLNFSPIITISFLFEFIDNWIIMTSYATINIIAIFSVGRENNLYNKIKIILLMMVFIGLSGYTLTNQVDYSIRIDPQFSIISIVLSIIGIFLTFIPFKNDTKNPVKYIKSIKFINNNLAYYTTTLSSNIILLLISATISTFSKTKTAFDNSEVYFYIIANTILLILKGFYDYKRYNEKMKKSIK